MFSLQKFSEQLKGYKDRDNLNNDNSISSDMSLLYLRELILYGDEKIANIDFTKFNLRDIEDMVWHIKDIPTFEAGIQGNYDEVSFYMKNINVFGVVDLIESVIARFHRTKDKIFDSEEDDFI